ncbi:MAG: hypothetical protein LW703_15535, partial [Rhodobacter sp.]|nr:hypothetical protein [Rhodobacter sp.]
MADIKDKETLEAWLTGRSREDAICIAHRAAMRVAPLFWIRLGENWAREGDLTALMSLRLLLISGVARKYPSPLVVATRAAARAAAVFSAATRAATRAAAADDAADAADAA